jgi:hypothetical protein
MLVPQIESWPTPRVLHNGDNIPYAVAIAAWALTLGFPRVF